MRNLCLVVYLFFAFGSCALNNMTEFNSDSEVLAQNEESNEESQTLHYIILKIPTNDWMEYRDAIHSTNDEIGYSSLRLTTVSFGKSNTSKEKYILFRRFQNYNEAYQYTQLLVETSSLTGLESLKIVTQKGYRKFSQDKSLLNSAS